MFSLYELIKLAKGWLGFFYLANNILTERKIVTIILALTLAVLGQSLLGFAQHFLNAHLGLEVLGESRTSLLLQKTGAFKLSRVGGTLGHPNALALFFIITLPAILNFLFVKGRAWLKVLALPVLIAGTLTLILTFSRSGMIAFLIAAGSTVFLGAWKNRGFLFALTASAVFWFFLLMLTLPFLSALSARFFEHDYGRALSRIPLMRVAMNMIQAHPLTGVGLNNYIVVMQGYDDTKEAISVYFTAQVHNMYLLAAAETGLPGLFFLLWLLAVAFKTGWDGFWKNEGLMSFFCLGFVGAFLGVLIQKLVEAGYPSSYFFSLMLGVFAASKLWHERQEPDR